MRLDGVTLDGSSTTADDYAVLTTTDPQIAAKYDMVEESDYWRNDES